MDNEIVNMIVLAVQPILIVVAGGVAIYLKRRLNISNEQGDIVVQMAKDVAAGAQRLAEGNEKAKPIVSAIVSGVNAGAIVWNDAKAPTPQMESVANSVSEAVGKLG